MIIGRLPSLTFYPAITACESKEVNLGSPFIVYSLRMLRSQASKSGCLVDMALATILATILRDSRRRHHEVCLHEARYNPL